MVGLTLVETSQGTFAMGGRFLGYFLSDVLKLVCPGDQIQWCKWREMPEELEKARNNHVAIPIPESYEICN